MLKVRPAQYVDFVRLAGELQGVSVWYDNPAIVAYGTKNSLPVAVVMHQVSLPGGFLTDFPDAIDVANGASGGITVDGVIL